ncbi:uncharacterized protein [Henckelia pumila]|uniref:uncharacterized protein n=1 Tax=Henckelia pumila TaxID=405737 RepID=UPI003C6DC217
MRFNHQDPSMKTMKHKQWTMYDDWCQIFGNERATGDSWKSFRHAVHDVLQLETEVDTDFLSPHVPIINVQAIGDDSVSDTNTPSSKPLAGATSKSKKRKQSNDVDESILAAINNIANITKDTMGELIKELATTKKLSVTQDKVFEALEGLHEFTEDETVRAAKMLFNNHNDLALFKRLGENGRISLLNTLLRNP